MAEWSEYQEEIAAFFRTLGFESSTNVRVEGTRTSHNVDVLVRPYIAGMDVLWIVECKLWKSRINKEHVFALRQIISDIGADRGFLMAESGFQRGAFEAAVSTNVRLSSLEELVALTSGEISMFKLRSIADRTEVCWNRYWNLPKYLRVEWGLRPDVLQSDGYRATTIMEDVTAAIGIALRGQFPMVGVNRLPGTLQGSSISAESPDDLVGYVEPLISDLEARLTLAEHAYEDLKKAENQIGDGSTSPNGIES